tara:strand:- start:176 stop:430 length:255 start_codon:yes stop_codon:yes gene_type:complete
MSEKFKDGAADRLLDRLEKDPSGRLRNLVNTLMEVSKELSKEGVPLDEIASTVTMFWYVGQNPEMENLITAFNSLNISDENSYN